MRQQSRDHISKIGTVGGSKEKILILFYHQTIANRCERYHTTAYCAFFSNVIASFEIVFVCILNILLICTFQNVTTIFYTIFVFHGLNNPSKSHGYALLNNLHTVRKFMLQMLNPTDKR